MILEPKSVEEAQALLGRRPVVFTGGGTKLAKPAEDAVVIRTAALNRILEYAPSDQVVTAECGVTVASLQRELAKNGQRLALDPPFAEKATLGGVVAANDFGPLRTRFGSVRDLIIGVSIVRADGTRAKGGGKVVKTVAGFDLPKLICGSQGTLGLIATVTFRVHPIPEEIASVMSRGLSASAVVDLVRRVRAEQLEPAAMLALRNGTAWDVYVRFEGFRAGVLAQRQKLGFAEAPASVWAEHLGSRGPVRFGALPTQLPSIEAMLGANASWYPMLGLGFADEVRGVIPGGWAGTTPAPPSLSLHKAVKQRLDPLGVLAPGSFVGGI